MTMCANKQFYYRVDVEVVSTCKMKAQFLINANWFITINNHAFMGNSQWLFYPTPIYSEWRLCFAFFMPDHCFQGLFNQLSNPQSILASVTACTRSRILMFWPWYPPQHSTVKPKSLQLLGKMLVSVVLSCIIRLKPYKHKSLTLYNSKCEKAPLRIMYV